MRIKTFHLMVAIFIMNSPFSAYANTDTIPSEYTGMADILVPTAPFKSKIYGEEYRFKPIVLIDIPNDKLELESNVYVIPNLKIKGDTLREKARHWLIREQTKNKIKFELVEQGTANVNKADAYYVAYRAGGYSDGRFEERNYISRVYFVTVSANQTALIYLVRNVKDDIKTVLISQWQSFLNSFEVVEPNPYTVSLQGKIGNTRRYITGNLAFDIPNGLPNALNRWRNKNNAEKNIKWLTPEGNIYIHLNIRMGLKSDLKSTNERIQKKGKDFENNAARFGQLLNPGYEAEYNYYETDFGANRKLYGYTYEGKLKKDFELSTSYKEKKAIDISIKGDQKVIEQYEDTIKKWLKNFVVLEK